MAITAARRAPCVAGWRRHTVGMRDTSIPTHHVTRRGLLAGLAGGLASPMAAAAWPRVALVVGNAAYASAPLLNPARDARAMAERLRDTGFEVIERIDATRSVLLDAVSELRRRLTGRQGTGLLYFAGHGLQLDWRNHLVPVDARLESAADVPAQTLDVQSVIEAFQAAGNRMNIVVLDACRDNPFGGAASGRGLAPVDAPPGTFLAYATAPGHLALDGSTRDGHGLYTRFLLQELQRRDARIEDVFKRVRLQVRQASNGRQVPWESTSLEEDFVFATGERMAAPAPAQRDAEFDAERAEWDRIAGSERPEDFFAFLQRHPNGRIAEQAQFRLDQLARTGLVQQTAPGLPAALPSGADRYRAGDEWSYERVDLLDGGRRQRLVHRVTAIRNGQVIVNDGMNVVDQMGGILHNRFGTKQPALLMVPSDLQLGRRWRTAFINTRAGTPPARSYYDGRVEALENVDVPAGRFRCYRLELMGESENERGGGRLLQVRVWVDPTTMLKVRDEIIQRERRDQRLLEHAVEELLWRRLAPRA